MFDDPEILTEPEISFKDYLQSNINPIYRIMPSIFITPITPDTITPFMLDNKIYCTGRIMLDVFCAITTDYSTDGAIIYGLPEATMTIRLNPCIHKFIRYVDINLFKRMIDESESPNTKTYLVKLRIIVNMIYNISYLTTEQKIKWSEWIKELAWARMACLNSWYIEYMLPY